MKEDIRNFNWETRFETADDLMIHTMPGGRMVVKSNIRTGIVSVELDGEEIETHEGLHIAEYSEFLLDVSAKAAALDNNINK